MTNTIDGRAELVAEKLEIPQGAQLGACAQQMRSAYAGMKRGFNEFVESKFKLGYAALCARSLLAIPPVDKNREWRTEQSRHPKANFTQADAGFMSWCRRELAEISYSTISRARAWVEKEALPALADLKDQMQLQLEDVRSMPWSELETPTKDALLKALKSQIGGKEMTLQLRAMNEVPGNPDHYGPTGGKRDRHVPRRSMDKIKSDDWLGEAKAWLKFMDMALANGTTKTLAAQGPIKTMHFWDILLAREIKELKERIGLLYDLVAESEAVKARNEAKYHS